MKTLKKLILKPGKLSEVNISSLLVIALLLFIPLYPKFPLVNIPQTYVAIRAEDFLVAAFLLIFFVDQVKNGFLFWQEKTCRLIVLYWFVGLLSVLSALFITKSIVSHLGWLHFLRRVEYMACFFIALSAIKKIRDIYIHLFSLFLSTVGVLAYGLGQRFLNWPVISTMTKEFSEGAIGYLDEWTRINATFAGHYDLAAYTVLILAITAAFLVWERKLWRRVLLIIFGFCAFYLLVLTASRISFIAYLVAVSATLLFLRKPFCLFFVLTFSLLFVFSSGELTERYLVSFSNLYSTISSLGGEKTVETSPSPKKTPAAEPESIQTPTPSKEKETIPALEEEITPSISPVVTLAFPTPEPVRLAAQRSTDIRFKVEWPRAARAFFKNPFLGSGYSSIDLATDNDYLRLLGETGILGFFSFILIFVELFRKSFLFLKKTLFDFPKVVVAGILGGAVGILVNALFIDVFEASKVAFVFWILAGTMVGTINLAEKQLKTV